MSAAPRVRARLLAWAPSVLYMAVIWALSSMSLHIALNAEFPYTDKIVHFFEYSGLALLLTHAVLRSWPDQPTLKSFFIAVLVTAAWGLLDELHQAFVPGRTADVFDLCADVLGALAGAGVRVGLRTAQPTPPPADEQAPT